MRQESIRLFKKGRQGTVALYEKRRDLPSAAGKSEKNRPGQVRAKGQGTGRKEYLKILLPACFIRMSGEKAPLCFLRRRMPAAGSGNERKILIPAGHDAGLQRFRKKGITEL